jgi:hypothetical protein
MKKLTMASVFSLALLVAFGHALKAEEIAKEGTGSGTLHYCGTFKVIAMGEERLQMTYELMGINTSDNPDHPVHNASGRTIGATHSVKGNYKTSGFTVYSCANGDQAFSTYEATGKLGVSSEGSYTWVGGTGELTGLEGDGVYYHTVLRPPAEGTLCGILKTKGNWKLP